MWKSIIIILSLSLAGCKTLQINTESQEPKYERTSQEEWAKYWIKIPAYWGYCGHLKYVIWIGTEIQNVRETHPEIISGFIKIEMKN